MFYARWFDIFMIFNNFIKIPGLTGPEETARRAGRNLFPPSFKITIKNFINRMKSHLKSIENKEK